MSDQFPNGDGLPTERSASKTGRRRGRHNTGPLSQFRATYTDIVPHERIVHTYDMWLDGVHASTSITTIVLDPSEDEGHPGTRLTFTEQGVHLDGVHGPGPQVAAGREQGTAGLLDAIGALLVAAVSKETV
jgi:uncharacterized protein YndB with AHSA1/START domain